MSIPTRFFHWIERSQGIPGQEAARSHQEQGKVAFLRVIRPAQNQIREDFLVFHGRLGIQFYLRVFEAPENGHSHFDVVQFFQIIRPAQGQDIQISDCPPLPRRR